LFEDSGTSKTGFGQVKFMKEFVRINRFFFLNLAFRQVGEQNYGKDWPTVHVLSTYLEK
jgi:hypothetical protein